MIETAAKLTMRVAGCYKNNKIILKSLYLCDTYESFPQGSMHEVVNKEIVNTKIDENSANFFGIHTPSRLIGQNNIDYKNPLPSETVYALLECEAPVKKGSGSFLVLIWFQDSDCDPIQSLSGKLKEIDWAESAKDFEC
ncbi:MAG: hypothetical protein ABH872_00925 [Candidatus Omnitrophota bacterium]